ncbi:MAG: glucose 1-dehydrogenase [Beijerinckiaceae bacterium]|nr:glucose 1-dehydrogenase [Beijerinckiaceae bacterium]
MALLAGRKALVTGASGGLGAHFARMLARNGAVVAVAARRLEDCARVVAEIADAGGQAVAVTLDVRSTRSVEQALGEAAATIGPLDILINNAGIAETAPWLSVTEEAFERVLDTNLKGAYRVATGFARHARERGDPASIVNIASILGLAVTGSVGPYAVSKAGLVQMTRSMALEWARFSIRVNALCPGYVETDINRDFFATEAGQAIIKRIPQRRLGQMADLDGALLLLAGPAGAYITGTTLAVDGGHLLAPL